MITRILGAATALAITGLVATSANAATLHLDGLTAPAQKVAVLSSPVPNSPSGAWSSGMKITDKSGTFGSFVAWCLDIAHSMVNIGESADYVTTNDPYSNSYSLSDFAISRVQAVFDANYGLFDQTNGDQATAFQMALWEAAYESDKAGLGMSTGAFQAASTGSTGLADKMLANAAAYAGPKLWNMTFFEVANLGPNRPGDSGQNLVTVSPVPVPILLPLHNHPC